MKRIAIADLGKNVLSLPRLAIPSLASTAERYKASVLALKSGDAAAAHFATLDAFLSSSAPVLQKTIVDLDGAAAASGIAPFSYIEPLMQQRLLTTRLPLVVKQNKAFVLNRGSVAAAAGGSCDGTQAGVAATMVHGIARWIEDVRANGLAVPAGKPFDVSQLLTEFGRSLIPSKDTDEVFTHPFEKLEHVIVLHDGHLYCIRVFERESGAVVDRALLQKAIEVLLTVTPDMDNAAPVSVLTAGSRGTWAQAYQELIKSPGNAAELRAIHEGIIVVCLDSKPWGGEGDGDGVHGSRAEAAALHGSAEEMENRWYDKHQMIVSADGQLAFNFEPTFSHRAQWACWIDGVMDMIAADTTFSSSSSSSSFISTASVDPATVPSIMRHMDVTYGKAFSAHIRTARAEATALVSDTEVHSIVLPYGRQEVVAKLGISCDAFVQLTLQVARFTLHEKLCATSEICATTGFFHGASELLRSATCEALAVAEKVADIKRKASDSRTAAAAGAGGGAAATTAVSTSDTEELALLIKAAARRHDAMIAEANAGAGVDRHLMALRDVAVRNGDKAGLAFFQDRLYALSGDFLLNTCEFSRPWLRHYTFGPAVENGYALGYVVGDDEVRMSLAAHTNSPATDVGEMTMSIAAAADTIARALGGGGGGKL